MCEYGFCEDRVIFYEMGNNHLVSINFFGRVVFSFVQIFSDLMVTLIFSSKKRRLKQSYSFRLLKRSHVEVETYMFCNRYRCNEYVLHPLINQDDGKSPTSKGSPKLYSKL